MRIPNIDFVIVHIEKDSIILNDINNLSPEFSISKSIEIIEVCTPTLSRRPKIKTIATTANQISISVSAYHG